MQKEKLNRCVTEYWINFKKGKIKEQSTKRQKKNKFLYLNLQLTNILGTTFTVNALNFQFLKKIIG